MHKIAAIVEESGLTPAEINNLLRGLISCFPLVRRSEVGSPAFCGKLHPIQQFANREVKSNSKYLERTEAWFLSAKLDIRDKSTAQPGVY